MVVRVVVFVALVTALALAGGDDIPVVIWELAVVGGVVTVAWRGLSPPGRSPALLGVQPVVRVAPPRVLAPLELEIAGSCDVRLGGDRRLRRRLLSLLRHRSGAGPQAELDGRRLLGDEAWAVLSATEGVTIMDELETIVDRMEQV